MWKQQLVTVCLATGTEARFTLFLEFMLTYLGSGERKEDFLTDQIIKKKLPNFDKKRCVVWP